MCNVYINVQGYTYVQGLPSCARYTAMNKVYSNVEDLQ